MNQRRGHTEETKRKISIANSTGKKPTYEKIYGMYITKRMSSIKVAKALNVSKPTALKWLRFYNIKLRTISEAHMGMAVYTKKGYDPESNRVMRGKFGRHVRPSILKRDNYTCTVCYKRGGGTLHVDHIKSWKDHPELRFVESNCRTLCRTCHYYVTFKRKYDGKSSWGERKVRRPLYESI